MNWIPDKEVIPRYINTPKQTACGMVSIMGYAAVQQPKNRENN